MSVNPPRPRWNGNARGRAWTCSGDPCSSACRLLLSGCHPGFWKHQQQPQSAPPQAPQDVAPAAVSVDLTKPLEQSPFRAEVTQDQRVNVHLDFGKVFETQGNYEAALLEYQEGLTAAEARGIGKTRSHDEALAHRRMGNALDRLGRFAQAEVHYKKSLKLSPKDPKIWNDAGYSYYLQGRWADAERTLKTAANLAPEDQKIKTNLGLVLAAAGRPQEAFKLLSQYSGDADRPCQPRLPARGHRPDRPGSRAVPSGPGTATQPLPGQARAHSA